MLPISLKLTNFTSYIYEEIDFQSYGSPFCIIGENGSGKSTIIDAITTALFFRARGTDSRGANIDELINENADMFEVEYIFKMNNNDYRIIRKKERNGKHELEFYINEISQTEKIKETQDKINNIIKIDYDTFLDTVCIEQGNSASFMKKKPNERKEVFTQVLGLDKYDALEKITRDKRINTKQKIDAVEVRFELISKNIQNKELYENELNIGANEIKMLNLEIASKETELEEILSQKAIYDQAKEQQAHILLQRERIKQRLEKLKSDKFDNENKKQDILSILVDRENVYDKIDVIEKLINTKQNEYTLLSNEKSSIDATNNMLLTQAKELKEKHTQLKEFDKGTCDFCGHDITSEYKESYLNELMDEGKKYLNMTNKNKSKIEKLITSISDLNDIITKNKKELLILQEKQKEIIKSETQLISVDNMINQLNDDIDVVNEEYQENLKINIEKLEERVFNDNTLRKELNELRSKLSNWQSKVAIAKSELHNISELESESKLLEDELIELRQLYDDYSDLIIAFGKKGIQAAIIENSLPEIEDEINKILKSLTNGSVSIQFRTQKERKSKTSNASSIETLDIIIISENGERTYETYSGGEKFRVDFACHVGLSKFLAKRADATIEFFIIDEGLGSQDYEAKRNFVDVVKQLTEYFEQIMLITHLDDIKESFTNKIFVEKTPNMGSKIKLID